MFPSPHTSNATCFCAKVCDPVATCSQLRSEFRLSDDRMQMLGSTEANADWPRVFGSSPWFAETSRMLLIIRCIEAFVFFVHWIGRVVRYFEKGYWFIYLTNWSLTVETAYICFAAATAFVAHRRLGQDPLKSAGPVPLPWFVRATWLLSHIAMPASLLVTTLFYTLETPVWKITRIPEYSSTFAHLFNFFILVFDLMLGNNPFYLKYTVSFMLYVILYLLWSLIHHKAKIGTYSGCAGVPSEDCPIYAALDWAKGKSTIILVFIVVCCVAPICQLPVWCCVVCRCRAAESVDDARELGKQHPVRPVSPALRPGTLELAPM